MKKQDKRANGYRIHCNIGKIHTVLNISRDSIDILIVTSKITNNLRSNKDSHWLKEVLVDVATETGLSICHNFPLNTSTISRIHIDPPETLPPIQNTLILLSFEKTPIQNRVKIRLLISGR